MVRVLNELAFSGFSWESDYIHIQLHKCSWYYQVQLKQRICLLLSISTPFNELFRQFAGLSLLRPHFTSLSSTGILTSSSIGFACRLYLRSRLTLIRLALIRKPQSSGGEVSHLPYRYLYLHLLFHPLQSKLPYAFNAVMECSPTNLIDSIASVICLCPIIIHAKPLD
jgi:hypothetical protein